MEPFDRRSGREGPILRTGQSDVEAPRVRSHSRARTPKVYRYCDEISGLLICFMVVFTPWAFGTTQEWSIWTMNITAYVLGLLLTVKWFIRWLNEHQPSRWDSPGPETSELIQLPDRKRDWLTMPLAALTFVILLYTLVSAVNARATWVWWESRFVYRDNCIMWLPHSYDRWSTFRSLWTYIGLACFFWSVRDWLLGKSSSERHGRHPSERKAVHLGTGASRTAAESGPRPPGAAVGPGLPREAGRTEIPFRLQLLLWVLCVNGAVLALESILQRLSGTNKLLWLVAPQLTPLPETQFGPYAYRANAASYFNLVWPVCFGFWFMLRQAAKASMRAGHRLGSGSYLVLLPGAVLMAACPIITTSRGGALVGVGLIVVTMSLLLWTARRESVWFRVGTCSLFAIILAFAAFLGYRQLAVRFKTIFQDQMSHRLDIYENALPIAREFPVLGTGPGTFGSLYQLYRKDTTQEWAAYVHDDWLETRITFGWVGFSMILLSLALAGARWFVGPGIPFRWEFMAMVWIAMGGCLFHAKFDFPLQIYSILLLFLLLAAISFCICRTQKVAA